MKRHHVWYGFVVLFVLLATTQTQAGIQPNPNIRQNKGSKGVVFVNHDQLLQIANSRGVKVITFKLSKDDLKKLAASDPKGCGCALQDQEFAGGSCMPSCLEESGVSIPAVAACVGACIAAGSGNLVALWFCAMCTGAGDAIMFKCQLRCIGFITQNVAPKTPRAPNLRQVPTRGGNSAKVRLTTTRSASLR